jgi:hypothetical protein
VAIVLFYGARPKAKPHPKSSTVGYSLMTSMTSEFHRSLGRLAKTNNPPSTQDATLIREIVDDIEQQDIEVRSKLKSLEGILQNLDHER